jgi:hypothetical protein
MSLTLSMPLKSQSNALSIEHAENQEFEFNLVRAYISMLEPQAKYLTKFPRDVKHSL